ncbi:hypothetical protein AVEN_65713-1, partial [Araneus ventricosus]
IKPSKHPLRGSPSLGGYGCPNHEVPRVLYSLPVYPPLCLLLFAAFFHPSTASEGALHEKLLPLCLLLMDSQNPHVLAMRGDPLDGWCTVGPRCINSAGSFVTQLAKLLGIKQKLSTSGAWR